MAFALIVNIFPTLTVSIMIYAETLNRIAWLKNAEDTLSPLQGLNAFQVSIAGP